MPSVSTNDGLVQDLIDLYMSTPAEQVISYEMMSEAINCDIRDQQFRWLMYKAEKRISDEFGAAYKSVRGVGRVRITDQNGNTIGIQFRGSTRRKGKREQTRMGNILRHSNSLGYEDRAKLFQEQRHVGLVIMHTYDKYKPPLFEAQEPPPPPVVQRPQRHQPAPFAAQEPPIPPNPRGFRR